MCTVENIIQECEPRVRRVEHRAPFATGAIAFIRTVDRLPVGCAFCTLYRTPAHLPDILLYKMYMSSCVSNVHVAPPPLPPFVLACAGRLSLYVALKHIARVVCNEMWWVSFRCGWRAVLGSIESARRQRCDPLMWTHSLSLRLALSILVLVSRSQMHYTLL